MDKRKREEILKKLGIDPDDEDMTVIEACQLDAIENGCYECPRCGAMVSADNYSCPHCHECIW